MPQEFALVRDRHELICRGASAAGYARSIRRVRMAARFVTLQQAAQAQVSRRRTCERKSFITERSQRMKSTLLCNTYFLEALSIRDTATRRGNAERFQAGFVIQVRYRLNQIRGDCVQLGLMTLAAITKSLALCPHTSQKHANDNDLTYVQDTSVTAADCVQDPIVSDVTAVLSRLAEGGIRTSLPKLRILR